VVATAAPVAAPAPGHGSSLAAWQSWRHHLQAKGRRGKVTFMGEFDDRLHSFPMGKTPLGTKYMLIDMEGT